METKIIVGFVIFFLVCAALACAYIIARIKKGPSPLALLLKTLASLVFVLGGLYASLISGFGVGNFLFVSGLIFALVGDTVLDLKVMHKEHEKFYLNSGLVLFSFSAALYLGATIFLCHELEKFTFLLIGSILIGTIVAIVVMLLEKPMKLDYSSYHVQVAIYSLILSLTTALGLGVSLYIHGFFLFSIGVLLVLVSDILLSFTYFKKTNHENVFFTLAHTLYYLGELLVMANIFFQLF